MKSTTGAVLALAFAGLVPTCASAQSWDAQQTAVWQVIATTWDMDQKQDNSWMTTMTHPNVSGWSMKNPAPRSRASLLKWSKLSQESSKMLMFELSPISIATSENAAVAHYYYTTANEDREGKRETERGYCSDTLIKQGDSWVFLGWNCGQLPASK
jgi:hypothetical protein